MVSRSRFRNNDADGDIDESRLLKRQAADEAFSKEIASIVQVRIYVQICTLLFFFK